MDGPFYIDSRGPHWSQTGSVITLTTTLQSLIATAYYPRLGANYFNWVGKALRMRTSGVITTGATPGNFNFQYQWCDNTSNAGTNFCGVTASGVTVNMTNNVWVSEIVMRARSMGASGSLMTSGFWMVQGFGFVLLPPSGLGSIGVDLTQNFVPSLQCSRTGSTGESMQVMEMNIEALN